MGSVKDYNKMHCFGCFFQLLLLVAMIKDQFGMYLLVQVEETKQIESSQVIPKVKVEGEKKIDIPQVIPQVEVEEEKKIDIPQVIPQAQDEEIKKIDTPQVVPQVEEEKKIDIPLPLTREIHPFARFQDGPAACTNPVPTEWVKKFEVKTEPEVIVLKGGQNVKFLVNLDVIKEIPEGSFLGVEVFGSGKLGRLPCIPVSIPNPKTGEEVDITIGSCDSPPYELEELLTLTEKMGIDCTKFGSNGCKLPIKPLQITNTFSWDLPKDFENTDPFQMIKKMLEGQKTTLDIRMRILNEDEEELACADAKFTVDFA